METITSKAGLKNAIQTLEIEQVYQGQLLKEQFFLTYESFKPVNLLKGAFKDIVTSPNLLDNILGTAVGIASGFVTKKIVIGASGNIFRKLLGSLLQVGVTNSVSQHPDAIKSVGHYIFNRFLQKKENITS